MAGSSPAMTRGAWLVLSPEGRGDDVARLAFGLDSGLRRNDGVVGARHWANEPSPLWGEGARQGGEG